MNRMLLDVVVDDGEVVLTSWGGRHPPRIPHPADQGPPLEDLDRLIARAERSAEKQWEREHGELPWPRLPADGRLFELVRR